MKKLIALAFIACIVFTSQDLFAQNIVLINGQPTEVTLEGEKITKLESKDVSTHMNGFEKERKDIFSDAKLRMAENNQPTISQPKSKIKTQAVTSGEKKQNEEQTFWVDSKMD